jgi:hypothetical protein
MIFNYLIGQVTPTNRYNFWVPKTGNIDGKIEDQLNIGVASNDINFCKFFTF